LFTYNLGRMTMQRRVVLGFVALLGAITCVATAPDNRSPLEGAWRFAVLETVSEDGEATSVPVHENLLLFTGHHYSLAFSRGETQSLPFASTWVPTDEEAVGRVAAIVVNTGTYEISGATLTTSPLFALVPSYVGGRADFEFSISGDTLTMRVVNAVSVDGVQLPVIADGQHDVYTLTRIE
jgi:hypothetical protein